MNDSNVEVSHYEHIIAAVELVRGHPGVDHIWLNAMKCVRPTDEFAAEVGREIIAKVMAQSSSLRENFFLVPSHRQRFMAASDREGSFERLRWTVVSVTPTDIVEPVYCAVVPDGETFTIEGFILTGNCPFCGSGDIVAGGDQTISCSFCNRSFLVMEQPQYNSMPGQPGATTDATMPGGDVPDPTDPNAADPTQPDAAAPAHQPVNPQTDPDALSKAPPFKFGGSLKIAADDMVCETCGWPLMKDFGGYTHKSGFPGKPHRVKPVPATSSSSSSVGDDEGDDGLTDLGRKLRKQIEDGSIFRTASGHPVNEDDFVAHIAFQVAREESSWLG